MDDDQPQTETSTVSELIRFIEGMRDRFPIEELREKVRVTPKGLFLERNFAEKFVPIYSEFLRKEMGAAGSLTDQRCKKKLFAEEDTRLYYLVEGKICLAGFLAPVAISQPHQYKLPYFLGSLSDPRTTLHVNDPIFDQKNGIAAVSGKQGVEYQLKTKFGMVKLGLPLLLEFANRARISLRTSAEFPEIENSLAEVLKTLHLMLERCHELGKDSWTLIPTKCLTRQDLKIFVVGGFHFILDKQGHLVATYELRAKNLYAFIRNEFITFANSGKGQGLGSFEIYPINHRMLGVFHQRRRRTEVLPHALVQFVEALPASPDKRDHLSNRALKGCFEHFTMLYQAAQPIERNKISGVLTGREDRSSKFLVNGVWIFVIGGGGAIEACLARHDKPRKHGPKNFRRRPNSDKIR